MRPVASAEVAAVRTAVTYFPSIQIAEHTQLMGEQSTQIGQLVDLPLRLGRIVEEQGRGAGENFARLIEAQERLTL